MRVYIANCTLQDHIVSCQPPEYKKTLSVSIPAGQQRYYGDFNEPQISAIAEKLAVYNMLPVDDAMKMKRVAPCVFKVGGMIPSATILKIIEHNRGLMREEGRLRRQKAAIDIGKSIDDQAPTLALEMSIEEEKRGETKDGASISEDPPIGEGVRFDKTDDAPRPPRRRRAA